MTLYLLIAAAILIISTAITFSSKAVTNQHLLAHLILFPIVYIVSGLPLEQMGAQFIAAGVAFILGILAFIFLKIGGGAARALIIVVLWVPDHSLLVDYFFAVSMGIFALAAIEYLIIKSGRIDHFATLVFAVCSGFLFYQYDLEGKDPSKQVTAQIQIEQALPALRSTNKM